MINKNQTTSEATVVKSDNKSFGVSENFFDTVKLNLPEPIDNDDPNISSLFGENDFSSVNPFIYEKDFLNDSRFNLSELLPALNLSKFLTRKVKIAATATVALVGALTVGTTAFQGEKSNYVAGASPLEKITTQNIVTKTDAIKNQIASGVLYNENQVISYHLQEGDTVARVAGRLNISADTIKLINNIGSDKEITGKESILVPTTSGIVHKVVSGDTLDKISKKYKVSIDTIANVNKGHLKNPHFLQIDQVLFIPANETVNKVKQEKRLEQIAAKLKINLADEKKPEKTVKTAGANPESKAAVSGNSRESNIVHKLAAGETIEKLAKKYGISIEKILAANPKIKPTLLQIDQPVIIPVNNISRNESRTRSVRLASRSLMARNDNDTLRSTGRFVWPAVGELSSGFGQRGREFHKGIDVAAAVGTPIISAASGKVIYTGWEQGYGMTVEIRHYNGLVTRYAHCSRIFVGVGQSVSTGERIAAIGMTGHVTGPHVHFEVLVNGTQENPRNYL
jgi:murein DD-endopeptidase MepM/ murein hydrolase activator NlpD